MAGILDTNPNAALREELIAAAIVLDTDIRGLKNFSNSAISIELHNAIERQITICNHRRMLIQNLVNAIDSVRDNLTALIADGYPSLTKIRLPPELLLEAENELEDLKAAIGLFETAANMAANLTISFGDPIGKPT